MSKNGNKASNYSCSLSALESKSSTGLTDFGGKKIELVLSSTQLEIGGWQTASGQKYVAMKDGGRDLMALAGSGEKLNHCYEDSRLWLHSRTRMRPDGSAHSNDVFRKSLPSLFVLQYDTFLLLYDRRF